MPGLSPKPQPASAPGSRDAAPVRRHLWLDGRVQGVFFRDGCRAEALRLGLAGWASNLPDGRVEVVLEGPADAVAVAEAWCARGPRRARVDRVEVRDEPVAGDTRFEVR